MENLISSAKHEDISGLVDALKPAQLHDFGRDFRERYLQGRSGDDLDAAIDCMTLASEVAPDNHPGLVEMLDECGVLLWDRSERSFMRDDADRSIALGQRVLQIAGKGCPKRYEFLLKLSQRQHRRFMTTASRNDVQDAIQLGREAIEVAPEGLSDGQASRLLANLAAVHASRYERFGANGDREEALQLGQRQLDLVPSDGLDRASALSRLAKISRSLYLYNRDLTHLGNAIQLASEALNMSQLDEEDSVTLDLMDNLASSLQDRHQQTGTASDLESAIYISKRALGLASPDNYLHRVILANYSGVVTQKYLNTGSPGDLEEAIDAQRQAMALFSVAREESLPLELVCNLASTLYYPYLRFGLMEDLDEALDYHRVILRSTPQDDPRRSKFLGHLMAGLGQKYERELSVECLDEAILLGREALSICPQGHTDRAAILSNLGTHLESRHGVSGAQSDLQQSIELARESVLAETHDDLERAVSMCSLGHKLSTRYLLAQNWRSRGGLAACPESLGAYGAACSRASLDASIRWEYSVPIYRDDGGCRWDDE